MLGWSGLFQSVHFDEQVSELLGGKGTKAALPSGLLT